MKRLLGPCLLACVLVLAGCGDSSSGAPGPSASDPAPTEPLTVGIVSETAAGGEVDTQAVSWDDEASRGAFLQQFERGSLHEKISAAISAAAVPEGYAVWTAVVAIGCDVPTGVEASPSGDGWVLDPQMPSQTMQECFAPVTSVAVVAVPA